MSFFPNWLDYDRNLNPLSRNEISTYTLLVRRRLILEVSCNFKT